MSDIPTFPPLRRTARVQPLIVTLLLAIGGGAVGAFLLLWFFPSLRQVYIPPGTSNVVVERPGKLVVEESNAIGERRALLLPQVAYVFRHSSSAAKLYLKSEAVGTAVLVTSDGWFATTADVKPAEGDTLLLAGKPLTVTKVVFDTSSAYALVKTDGRDLSQPVVFADSSAQVPGTTVFVLFAGGDTVKTSLVSTTTALNDDQTLSSDRLSSGFALATTEVMPSGTPVFMLSGELLGLVYNTESRSLVLPANTLSHLLTNVLRIGKADRAALGVPYTINLAALMSGENEASVFIVAGKAGSGPLASGSAKGILRPGDVLLAVDDQALRTPDDLYQVVQRMRPGDKLSIHYKRGDSVRDVTITLATLTAP